MSNKRFKVSKWIMLSLALLSNAFIITYSCLSGQTTEYWNRAFTSVFANLINNVTKKEVKNVPLESVDIKLSNEEGYVYNYIPGYQVNEIPLGSAKQIECNFLPTDATNKSITYSVSPEGSVILNQNGSLLSAVGMKLGECTITATSNDGGFTSNVVVYVVEPVAPVSFVPSVENTTIELGTTETIQFDIDGGVLTHDELINFRYYDIRKLTYTYNSEIISIDDHGVIYPLHEGTSSIEISNGKITKSLNITVEGSSTPVSYTDLKISGDNFCRENEMIIDQTTHSNNHQLSIKDGEIPLISEDFVWSSSNELLAKVDRHGVLRGFRKSSNNDEQVTITATSKITEQSATFDVLVKKASPSKINYTVVVGQKAYWEPKEQIVSAGDQLTIKLGFSPISSDKAIAVTCSDSSVISFSNEGTSLSGHILKPGKCTLTVVSEANSNAGFVVSFIVVEAGAITSDDMEDVGYTIRKSLGHAVVFMVCQIFTFLAFYMFLYDKKWWLYSSLSLLEGLFISGLSELIQYFVPTRAGTLIDVLIDFGGVVVGFIVAVLIVLLIKNSQRKKLKE